MKPSGRPPNARRFLDELAASGRYHFSSADAQSALAVTGAAAKVALNRLAKQGAIASPARGFYVIVPPNIARSAAFPPISSSRR